MRSTCSLYVDVGYLLAAAATRATGTSLRAGIHVNYDRLIAGLVEQAQDHSDLPVLRVHWYDSARNGVPDVVQERIGELPKVKLRLGRFGVDGQQKGVDLRIGLDLVAHARNDASDVFFLVSGDDDLTEAVEEAQVHGVQVVVLAVPSSDGRPHGVSRHLLRAADELDQIDGARIDEAVVKVEVPRQADVAPTAPTPTPMSVPSPAALASRTIPKPAPPRREHVPPPAVALAYSGSTGQQSHVMPGFDAEHQEIDEEVVTDVVRRILAAFRKSASPQDLQNLQRARPSIPPEIDKALLTDASDAIGVYDLSVGLRYRLRSRFWEVWDEA